MNAPAPVTSFNVLRLVNAFSKKIYRRLVVSRHSAAVSPRFSLEHIMAPRPFWSPLLLPPTNRVTRLIYSLS